jgi:predicted O-methyltransferase YrrM
MVEAASGCSLQSPEVARTLDHVHRRARLSDVRLYVREGPRYLLSRLTGRDYMSRTHHALRGAYAAVPRAQGVLLYMLARASKARHIVEFGCSYGVSTLYLGAAARDEGGRVVTTEIDDDKCEVAEQHFRSAGLSAHITVLRGDALSSLRTLDSPVDLLFLDGVKHLYLPVLELLGSRLHRGSLVVADNAELPAVRPLLRALQDPQNGYVCTSLERGRMAVAYRL